MSKQLEQSREQWEAEIRARQQNVTPADYPEGLQYVKGLLRIKPQWRFWTGVVVAVIGFSFLHSEMPPAIAILSIAGGFAASISATRWKD